MSTTPKRPPNILWIFGDQHRGQTWSGAGDPNVSTPHLDRLAVEGISFQHAVSGCPLCCPARGTLLTGLLPHRAVHAHEQPLDPAQPTLATELGRAGYHTAWFGKWHLDGGHEYESRMAFHHVPRERRGDFHTWLGYENNNSPWDCWLHGHRGDHEVPLYVLPDYETDALTDLLIAHLRERADQTQPFFAALSAQPPHNPYAAPAEWMQRHHPARVQLRPNVPAVPAVVDRARRELAGYHAMIENLDWNLGRIRTALTDLGLARDTIIVFFSDHGDMHGSHGQFLKMCPWEEAIRVPCVIGGETPFYERRQGRLDDPFSLVDLAPTTLGLCGLNPPDWMQGYDYASRWRPDRPAATPAPEVALLQCVTPTGHDDSVDRPWRGLITRDRWKYVCLEHQPWLLFDLSTDPYEQVNLAHNPRHAAQRRRLHDALAAELARVGDTFALPD